MTAFFPLISTECSSLSVSLSGSRSCDAVWAARSVATREIECTILPQPIAEAQEEAVVREAILVDVAENVATITLNRPDSLNSFNKAMADDMTWAWETVRDTDDIHCAVLQANGDRAFCTGMDGNAGAAWFTLDNVWNSFDPGMALAPKIRHRVWKPVITAVHGMAA